MMDALDLSTGEFIGASPQITTAICPLCRESVIPKCGNINVHHWSHLHTSECDNWWEPETKWHRYWKSLVKREQREVTIQNHRADIVRNNGMVVELQNSSISVDEIYEREKVYKNMIWLFNGEGLIKYETFIEENCICALPDGTLTVSDVYKYEKNLGRLFLRPKKSRAKNIFTFRWLHPRKHYGMCNKPVFIDLGDSFPNHYLNDDKTIFHLRQLHLKGGPPYGGWGTLGTHEDFIEFIQN